jgi:protein-disulfide isomerase
MLHEIKRILFPTLFLFLIVVPAGAFNQMEPEGLILGGSPEAPVRIEVFSNFECTHCREYYLRTIKKVLKEYSSIDKVCVIYHDFPFSQHKYDRQAAKYAEAASRVGQETLLKVFDAFYKEQAEWSQNGELEKTLKKTLSGNEYEKLMKHAEDPEIDSLIEKQYQLAMENGLKVTPTSFLFYEGKKKKVESVITYIVLKGFIDQIVH